jgi:hypothetical protein
MTRDYYAARNSPPPARDKDVDAEFWQVFREYMMQLSEEDALAESFPDYDCPDGRAITGTNRAALSAALTMATGHAAWPPPEVAPDPMVALDWVEFVYDKVSKVGSRSWHTFFQHEHLRTFDGTAARADYLEIVNRALSRMGYFYELREGGEVVRLSVPEQDAGILDTRVQSGDTHLDALVQRAVADFYNRTGLRKQQALEAIVDAFERVKTLEAGDKKASLSQVLDKATSNAVVRKHLDDEMAALTAVANETGIRHHETDQQVLVDDRDRDYFFYRYYNVVRVILHAYGHLSAPTPSNGR